MGKQKKIQDFNLLYSLLHCYVSLTLRLSYRTIRYVGLDKIPTDSAIIYAPNHTNALMDALVILTMDRKPKVFVARADIFKIPILAKIFRFMKIMPIMRIRDGIDEVRKNNETIEKAVDVLRDNVPFCIFPEGQHLAKYSSLPLSKGIFRIAFQAQSLMPDRPLYIVPVGIRYGNFFRFRSTVRVQIGDPIDVGEFVAQHNDVSEQCQMNQLKEILTERMRSSIFYIKDDEDYDATYEICAAVVKQQARLIEQESSSRMNRLDTHFRANKITVEQIDRLREQNPSKLEQLLNLGREAFEIRKAKNISISSVSVKYPILSRVLKCLFLICILPYCIPVTVLTLPIKLICTFAFTKLKDRAFHNSIRYLVNLVVWPILIIIYSAIALCSMSWQWAVVVIALLLPAPVVAHETWRLIRLLISDMRFFMDRGLRNKYQRIREIMFQK